LFVGGGAALVAGLLGIYLAQPYAVEKPVTIAPAITATSTSLVVRGWF